MDKYSDWFKSHKYFGFVAFIAVVTIGIGSFTDAVGKIRVFVSQYQEAEETYLTLKVHNQLSEAVDISPYVKYYISHPIAVIPTYSPTGRLVLPNTSGGSGNLSINSGEIKTYYIPIPSNLIESSDIDPGSNRISFLIEPNNDGKVKLQYFPFIKDAFSRFFVKFDILPSTNIREVKDDNKQSQKDEVKTIADDILIATKEEKASGIQYVTWGVNGNEKIRYLAKIEQGKFSNAPQGNWKKSTPSDVIAYYTKGGSRWFAKIEDGYFKNIIHTMKGEWHTSNEIVYLDWNENARSISVSDFPGVE